LYHTAIAVKAIIIKTIPENTKIAPNAATIREKGFIRKIMSRLSNTRKIPNNIRHSAINSIFQGLSLLANYVTSMKVFTFVL
jgi:hypothetical protein